MLSFPAVPPDVPDDYRRIFESAQLKAQLALSSGLPTDEAAAAAVQQPLPALLFHPPLPLLGKENQPQQPQQLRASSMPLWLPSSASLDPSPSQNAPTPLMPSSKSSSQQPLPFPLLPQHQHQHQQQQQQVVRPLGSLPLPRPYPSKAQGSSGTWDMQHSAALLRMEAEKKQLLAVVEQLSDAQVWRALYSPSPLSSPPSFSLSYSHS